MHSTRHALVCLTAGVLALAAGRSSPAQTTCPSLVCVPCTASLPTQCFDMKDVPSASCGLPLHRAYQNTMQFTLSGTYCGVGASAQFSRSITTTIDLVPTPCQRCWAQVCFPGATISTKTCTRQVVDRWGCRSSFCECLERVPVSCHTETYMVTSIDPGRADYSRRCVDASCECKHDHGQDCPCAADNPPGTGTPGPNTLEPITDVITVAPYGSKAITFGVWQLANKGFSLDLSPLNTVFDLTLAQLADLRDVVEEAINDGGLDRTDTEVVLVFADASGRTSSYAEFASLVATTKAFKLSSRLAYDVDGDGVLDENDLFLAVHEYDAAEAGWSWMSRADVNGDNAINMKDLCDIAHALATK